MSKFVGIDLGTTFSAVAHIDDHGRAVVLPNADGERITPSVVYLGSDPPLVGMAAKEMQRDGAADVASFFKRSMGDAQFALSFNGRTYTAIDLSVLVLARLKADAEAALGDTVTQAVITVPAYFNNSQREATIEAGRLAGLEVLRIINEPTAAALAYGAHQSGRAETLLVYDLGGGTFDVTLVAISAADIQVKATDGDHQLGGKDWDDQIVRFMAARFREQHGTDPLDDALVLNDLLVRAEKAKKDLTSRASTTMKIGHGGVEASYTLTREQFEEQTAGLMERTQRLTEQVLAEAGLGWPDLTGVLLVGGSTRMPMVHRYVQQMSGKPPRTGVNQDEAVALGAAIQAAIDVQARSKGRPRFRLVGERRIQDVMSHSLGMVALNDDRSRYVNSIIIPKNLNIPARETRPFKLRTRRGNENRCEVYVTQGESDRPTQCAYLGKYVFEGVAHDQSGTAVLDVTYAYDHNGVVQVSGVDRGTGASLSVTVEQVPADMSWVENPPEEKEEFVPAHITIYLLIDVSGSMSGAPLAEAQQAAEAFVQRCDLSHMSVGLISFGDRATTVVPTCQDARALRRGIRDLEIEGGTDMTAGLEHADQELGGAPDPKFIVLMTDGYPNDQRGAAQAAGACHAAGIQVIAIGTSGADVQYLRQLSSADEQAIFANPGELVSTFSAIAQAITEGSAGPGTLRKRR